jgi:hypothetical protein
VNGEVVVKRRICFVAAALSVTPLAFGVATATAAKTKTAKPKVKVVRVACATNVGVMVAPGDTGVTPPVQQGDEYGTASCGKLLGQGIQKDAFTVPDTGDTLANYTVYFRTGAIYGKYDLTPQEGSASFLQTDYLGTITVTGGTGAYQGIKGSGTMTCQTLDGIHTTCTDNLKLKPKVR